MKVTDEGEKRDKAADAIEEAIAWHTVGIVPGNRPDIGTGTALAWNSRNLIVTAKHVVKGLSVSDLWFLFRPPDKLTRKEARQIRLTKEDLMPRGALRIRELWLADHEDFAVIE